MSKDVVYALKAGINSARQVLEEKKLSPKMHVYLITHRLCCDYQ